MTLQVDLHKRGLKRILGQNLIIQKPAEIIIKLSLVPFDQCFENCGPSRYTVLEQQFFIGPGAELGIGNN